MKLEIKKFRLEITFKNGKIGFKDLPMDTDEIVKIIANLKSAMDIVSTIDIIGETHFEKDQAKSKLQRQKRQEVLHPKTPRRKLPKYTTTERISLDYLRIDGELLCQYPNCKYNTPNETGFKSHINKSHELTIEEYLTQYGKELIDLRDNTIACPICNAVLSDKTEFFNEETLEIHKILCEKTKNFPISKQEKRVLRIIMQIPNVYIKQIQRELNIPYKRIRESIEVLKKQNLILYQNFGNQVLLNFNFESTQVTLKTETEEIKEPKLKQADVIPEPIDTQEPKESTKPKISERYISMQRTMNKMKYKYAKVENQCPQCLTGMVETKDGNYLQYQCPYCNYKDTKDKHKEFKEQSEVPKEKCGKCNSENVIVKDGSDNYIIYYCPDCNFERMETKRKQKRRNEGKNKPTTEELEEEIFGKRKPKPNSKKRGNQ